MKKLYVIGIFWICFLPCKNIYLYGYTSQVIIHFSNIPLNQKQHIKWNKVIDYSVYEINKWLINEGLIFEKKILKYPNKPNFAFFTRKDYDLGIFTIFIPEGVNKNLFVKKLSAIYSEQGLNFNITSDYTVIINSGYSSLEGQSLSLEELEKMKKQSLIPELTKKINILKNNKERNFNDIMKLEKKIKSLELMKTYAFWYQEFPTTGLRMNPKRWPVSYPFIPHFFYLWELAPRKGKGIKLALIDTGVAAFGVPNSDKYKKNQDLYMFADFKKNNFNLVSDNGLNPLEQLIYFIQPHIKNSKFNYQYLIKIVPKWIVDYLKFKETSQIEKYLIENAKDDLLNNGQLSQSGKKLLNNILSGDYGIEKFFQIKKGIDPIKEEVIFEFLPLSGISDERTTLIAGHGSHTFGIIGANLEKDAVKPDNDTGICGLAPYADIIMIKAFGDDGITEKSTLISAIKDALVYDADIINLSLKISDRLNLSKKSSKLLKRVVGLAPYVIAASGNNGNPDLPEYPGLVEAYPARFASVFYDVGSFSYNAETGRCPISHFSQYEPGIGPLFVAPGCNILSSALIPDQKNQSEYVFMNGTSMASSIMAGFVALMLAEFKEDFTKDQLLKVSAKSTIKLQNTNDWHEKVMLGVLDMRTALFILHVLREIKRRIPQDFDKKFDNYLEAVNKILFGIAQEYSDKYLNKIDIRTDFLSYINAAKNKNNLNNKEFFIPSGKNRLKKSIDFVVDILIPNFKSKKINISEKIMAEVFRILKDEKLDIFENWNAKIKKRIRVKEDREIYWAQQLENLKKNGQDFYEI